MSQFIHSFCHCPCMFTNSLVISDPATPTCPAVTPLFLFLSDCLSCLLSHLFVPVWFWNFACNLDFSFFLLICLDYLAACCWPLTILPPCHLSFPACMFTELWIKVNFLPSIAVIEHFSPSYSELWQGNMDSAKGLQVPRITSKCWDSLVQHLSLWN